MLLDTQYRMHPLIADYPSRQFYQGLLHSGISAQDRPLPKGQLLPSSNFLSTSRRHLPEDDTDIHSARRRCHHI